MTASLPSLTLTLLSLSPSVCKSNLSKGILRREKPLYLIYDARSEWKREERERTVLPIAFFRLKALTRISWGQSANSRRICIHTGRKHTSEKQRSLLFHLLTIGDSRAYKWRLFSRYISWFYVHKLSWIFSSSSLLFAVAEAADASNDDDETQEK